MNTTIEIGTRSRSPLTTTSRPGPTDAASFLNRLAYLTNVGTISRTCGSSTAATSKHDSTTGETTENDCPATRTGDTRTSWRTRGVHRTVGRHPAARIASAITRPGTASPPAGLRMAR